MIGLIWNSMMSWAGGWFFLMASEQFVLGNRSFQLPGLGSYLQVAANKGNVEALLLGLLTLIILIVLLDMDEPFSALDVLTAANLRKELLSLWRERKIPTRAIVMVTHNIDEAVSMADRILVLGADPGHIRVEL
jgi:ABC-type anion transport system duplicated permease subunit